MEETAAASNHVSPTAPPEIGVAPLKSDMNVKKESMVGFTKLYLLHQSLTGAGDLDPGGAQGCDVTRAGAGRR